jgi:tankyrase
MWDMLSALHRCAREDNLQACRILLSYNVDPSIVSLQGYAAAQVATENVLKILQGIGEPYFLYKNIE